jgi:hypothetical protein
MRAPAVADSALIRTPISNLPTTRKSLTKSGQTAAGIARDGFGANSSASY